MAKAYVQIVPSAQGIRAALTDVFGEETDVVFASHNWPTWGHDRAIKFLSEQRDLYAYLHD